jgi:MFS family permease
LLAPTALSLLAVSFTQPRERATAFAVYGSIAGSGAAIGLLLGGALTQYLSWRWCLYVNVPIAVIAAVGGSIVLPASSPRTRPKFDVPGVVLATGGLVALVYACTEAVRFGWSSAIGLLGASLVLLALFLAREARTANPLLPLRILADRNRGATYITVALSIAGMFGAFLFLTYYLQVVLRYTPFQAGLAFLPMTVASQAGSWLIASRLMPYVPPRALMAPGAAVAAAGMALLTQLNVDSTYLTLVMPAEVLLGLGISCVMVPAFSIATQRVDPREVGVASATVNTAQQIGGSLGTALLTTVSITATAGYVGARAAALVHGFSAATAWGVAILVLGALVAGVLINAPRPTQKGA